MQSDYKVRLCTWVKAHFVCTFPSHHLGYDLQIYHQIRAQCRCHVILIVFGGYTLFCYGVAPASRIDKIISLVCKRALQKRHYSAKETNKFIDDTDRSHPINKNETCHQIRPWFCSEFSPCVYACIFHSLFRAIIWIVILNPITKFALDFAPVALRCVSLVCLSGVESIFDATKTTQSNCNPDIIIFPSFFLEHLISHFRDLLVGLTPLGIIVKS